MQVENVCLLHEYITIKRMIATCLIRVFPPDLLGQWNRSVPLMHPLNCYAPLPPGYPRDITFVGSLNRSIIFSTLPHPK